MASSPGFHSLWSKMDTKDQGLWNSLPSHSIDVGVAAYVLWTSVVPDARRKHWEHLLGLAPEQTALFISFIAATHDLGKATPSFSGQASAQSQKVRLQHDLSLQFPPFTLSKQPFRHGTATAVLLPGILKSIWPELDGTDVAERYAAITGAHHGKVAATSDYRSVRKSPGARGAGRWETLRDELVEWLRETSGFVDTAFPLAIPSYADALWLAGLISIADWIGSNEDFFHYQRPSKPPYDVSRKSSLKHAGQALGALRWFEQPLNIKAATFDEAFPNFDKPNATQRATETAALEMSGPGILIVEAQTGSGKTEAALFVAEYAQQAWDTRGMYVAMPTMATSDQLYDRVCMFYTQHNTKNRYVNLQLLHGHAALSAELKLLTKMDLGEAEDEWSPKIREASEAGDEARVRAATWFKGRGKGLLAPAGVGTIDQALLGVLSVRHHFVRLYGLSSKTIIFDEIHSYDVYMNELFLTLLEFLGALGSPVVLLSATLPRHQTQTLLAAYARGAGWSAPTVEPAVYPRITFSDGTQAHTTSRQIADDGTVPPKTVAIEWKLNDGDEIDWHAIGHDLRSLLREGGTAAVICNTVREAQNAFRTIRAMWCDDALGTHSSELQLFHARFRFIERMERQEMALRTFGKDAPNPRPRRVIVATQVIEQSLDLDFDVMVSMLCPSDLLIQRVGRLHRHNVQRDAERKPQIRQPALWILSGSIDSATGLPYFHAGSQYIYGEHILLRSWLALQSLAAENGKTYLHVPDDIERVIEATYDDRDPPPAFASIWNTSLAKMTERVTKDRREAEKSLIPGLFYEGGDPFTKSTIEQEVSEDAPELHASALARTRLGPPTVDVIIVSAQELESTGWVKGEEPTRAQVIELLGYSVSLSDYRIAKYLLRDAACAPVDWQESPHLRHHRLLTVDESGAFEFKDIERKLVLNEELGVVIQSTSQEELDGNPVV